MTWLDTIPFAVLLASAGVALRAHQTAASAPALEDTLRIILGFFGIGRIEALLAAAVWLSVAAIAGGALDFVAHAHLAAAYPAWFALVAVASGLAVGLLAVRLVASAAPSPTEPEPGIDDANPPDESEPEPEPEPAPAPAPAPEPEPEPEPEP